MSKCNECGGCDEKGFSILVGEPVCNADCALDIPVILVEEAARPIGLAEFNRAIDSGDIARIAA